MKTNESPVAWINGNIITLDGKMPRARAIVVSEGRITYAGNDDEALRLAGTINRGASCVRDLRGRTVVPGFNDNHVHAVYMAENTLVPDLSGLDGREIVALLKARYQGARPGDFIRAFNWDYPSCPSPRKEILDEAFPRNPVILTQYSGHAQWLNSAALRRAGISKRSPDPAVGSILRDPDGEPTGIVRDLKSSVTHKRSRSSFSNRRTHDRLMDIALGNFSRLGITSIQDNGWYYQEPLALDRRFARGDLTARVSVWSLGRDRMNRIAMETAFSLGAGVPDWVREGPVKYFFDGTFSTRNACMFEPFLDSPEDTSSFANPVPPVKALTFLAKHKRQGAFHIIGDRGVAVFLDAYESVLEKHPELGTLRIRIEHAQLVKPDDIGRIARLGVLVAAQPTALGAPEKDRLILGEERALRAYPYRSMLDSGVRLSFGSDIPGESECDPLLAIHLAANREGPERITAEEALRCYTAESAYAEFMEARKGQLSAGMLADFAVLSDDLTSVQPSAIRDVFVEETVVGGRSVYKKT